MDQSIFLLFPLGAGDILGVYVTVLVTISLTCLTLDRVDFGDLISKYLPLLFRSQSNGERALRALKGERMADVAVALNGDSAAENAGEGGIRKRPNLEVDGAEEGKTNVAEDGTVKVGDL